MSKLTEKIGYYFRQLSLPGGFLSYAKLTGITGGTQILIQALGLASGIVVIRLLSTQQYALYTLANTMLGTMTVLADSGIGAGVMAEGGKVWKERNKLGEVVQTGLDLRKKFAVGSLLLAAPFLIYILMEHGADWTMAIVILLSLIPAFISSLTGTIFMIPLKLNQDIPPLQKNILAESAGRFLLIFSLFVLPWAYIAILGSSIPRIIANIRLKKLSSRYADWGQRAQKDVRKRILAMVKRLMPGAIYYCISGQLSVWLIGIFGTTGGVAGIGALGRISISLTVISTIFGTLVYPRFARLEASRPQLFRRFLQIIISLLLISGLVVLAVYLFAPHILWVLGDQYSGLEYELVLSVIGSCLGLLSGSAFTLSTNRSWAVHPMLSIPVSIVAIVVGVLISDVSILRGVLLFNIFVAGVQFLLNSGYFVFKIFQKKDKLPQENLSQTNH